MQIIVSLSGEIPVETYIYNFKSVVPRPGP